MAEDLNKPKPDEIPASDQNMLQSEAESAVETNKYQEMVRSGQAKDIFEARAISSREENLAEWERRAEIVRKNFSIWQKIIGRGKITPEDMAQEEQEKVMNYIDDLIESGQATNFDEAIELFRNDPDFFHAMGEKISREQLLKIQTNIEKEEKEQLEFEILTKKTMKRFRSLNPSQRFRSSEDLPIDYAAYGDEGKYSAEDFRQCTPGVICDFLFGTNRNAGYPESFSVLEIGGGHNPKEYFFKNKTHYTNLDVNYGMPPEEELGAKTENGKLCEDLLMDAIDVQKYLEGRTYDYVFGLSVFGWPTEWSAENYYKQRGESMSFESTKSKTANYEKQLLKSISSVSRPGGLMLFSTREMMFHFDSEELREIGFDYAWKWIDSDPHILLRKTPKSELETQTQEPEGEG